MINNLKLGLKTLRFAHALKSSLIIGIVMAVLGVAMCLMGILGEENFMGGYFIMMLGLFLIQMLWSVNISNLVQASPVKKRLQTSVPAVLSTFCMTVGYLIVVLTEIVVGCIRPDRISYICVMILFTAIVMDIIMFYAALCYKYFVLATILFIACFVVCYGFLMTKTEQLAGLMKFGWGSFVLITVLGIAILWVSGVLQYFISLAVYKAPMSKHAQSATLRRQL